MLLAIGVPLRICFHNCVPFCSLPYTQHRADDFCNQGFLSKFLGLPQRWHAFFLPREQQTLLSGTVLGDLSVGRHTLSAVSILSAVSLSRNALFHPTSAYSLTDIVSPYIMLYHVLVYLAWNFQGCVHVFMEWWLSFMREKSKEKVHINRVYFLQSQCKKWQTAFQGC